MSLWWLQPGWAETRCSCCGSTIYPEGDEARRIVEQIGLPPFRKDQSAADYFDAVIADFVGDTWAVDPRAED